MSYAIEKKLEFCFVRATLISRNSICNKKRGFSPIKRVIYLALKVALEEGASVPAA